MTTVLGVDPSLTGTGLAWIQDGRLVGTRRVVSAGHRSDSLRERSDRLTTIALEVLQYIWDTPHDLVMIEGVFTSKNTGSLIDRCGLWWQIVHGLMALGLPVVEVSSHTRQKYATGNGSANKSWVFREARARYGTQNVPIPTDDEADAVVLAAIGCRLLGQPIEIDLPEEHLIGLEKIRFTDRLEQS